jgi:hypothetical protein
MNKFLIISLFFLFSCTSNTTNNDFNLSDEMTFDEFRVKLEKYIKENSYPNIDD